ncbi:hypothetical protein G7Y89_g11245 [Cudoniella acicularis]|uniref:DUF1772-domain-containing protein n=1 Tax=Cudoniella acicularis TaxID=354080 RepID=A0A8H4W0A4_9HELO|nr:hypothetical protein G7Y89_g11245 [Cudoniella acicularis]
MFTIPAIRKAHSTEGASSVALAKVWTNVYNAGKALNPPVALAVASSFAYLAWSSPSRSGTSNNNSRLYTLAAALTMGIVPFTLMFMAPTNNKIFRKAAQAATAPAFDSEFGALIERWSTLNFVRSLLPLLGGVVGMAAILA